MIVETAAVKKILGFFRRMFQSRREQKEQEMEQSWKVPSAERKDLVDYTNLLFDKANRIKRRENKELAREIRSFAQRNCLAGVIPDSELERVHKETGQLLEKMGSVLKPDKTH
jgi:hypothetical protein